FDGICLGKGVVEELAMEGFVGLTTLLEGSGFSSLGCTFLGKGDIGVRGAEGKTDEEEDGLSMGTTELRWKWLIEVGWM
ncbi:hypothetical protein KI387_031254, partial [Taxus chinensis]